MKIRDIKYQLKSSNMIANLIVKRKSYSAKLRLSGVIKNKKINSLIPIPAGTPTKNKLRHDDKK
jgi:hypothetical protein